MKKEETRKCSVCGKIKPLKSFPKNVLKSGEYRYTSNVCCSCKTHLYREREKEKQKLQEAQIEQLEQGKTVSEMIIELNRQGYMVLKAEDFNKLVITENNEVKRINNEED